MMRQLSLPALRKAQPCVQHRRNLLKNMRSGTTYLLKLKEMSTLKICFISGEMKLVKKLFKGVSVTCYAD